jgi:hypothetical protein
MWTTIPRAAEIGCGERKVMYEVLPDTTMNKICKHCKKEKLEIQRETLFTGDLNCCGGKKREKCKQIGHKIYVCRGVHMGAEGPIGDLIFKHNE